MFISAISLFIGSWFFPSKHTMGKDAYSSSDSRIKNPSITGAKQVKGKAQDAANTPMVLRVHSSEVLSKEIDSNIYLNSIQNENLDEMLAEGIKEFTKQKDLKKAWLEILTDYKKGDKIAIKPNFNSLNHGYKYTITSPQLVNSVVKHLVEVVGARPNDIFLYDLCKKIPADIVRNRINYPVNYIERIDAASIFDKIISRLHYGLASADPSSEIKMRERIIDEKETPVKCYMPKIVTQVQHIINLPLFTNHIYIANSGALKNHYGTVRFSNFHSYPGVLHGSVLNKSVTDINQHPQIKNKTRIIIADGIFGVFDRGEGEGKRVWKSFNKDFPKSIFISKDPVAIDSVMASLIIKERKTNKFKILSTEYLEDAMDNGLGIHELSGEDGKFSKIRYEEINI